MEISTDHGFCPMKGIKGDKTTLCLLKCIPEGTCGSLTLSLGVKLSLIHPPTPKDTLCLHLRAVGTTAKPKFWQKAIRQGECG